MNVWHWYSSLLRGLYSIQLTLFIYPEASGKIVHVQQYHNDPPYIKFSNLAILEKLVFVHRIVFLFAKPSVCSL